MVNKWSRDDLPSISDLCQADDERGNGERTVTLAIALDAVVDRLNKDFPKSYDRGGLRGSTWAERERDMWRDRYRALQSEYARQSQAWSEQRADYEERLARAEAAEARTTPAVPLHQPDGTHMDASHLPIGADYEQRLAPTGRAGVYDAEMEAEVRRRTECLRENLRGVEAARDEWEGKYWAAVSGKGESPDPVEELAGQIESATREAIRQVCDDLADVVPSLDPLTVEQAMEVTAASRKVAAHVLGQEADQ